MAIQKETISTLNDLIETLKDGQEGFRQAAEAVADPKLKSLFNEYSLQRARFAGELQSQAVALGESCSCRGGSRRGRVPRLCFAALGMTYAAVTAVAGHLAPPSPGKLYHECYPGGIGSSTHNPTEHYVTPQGVERYEETVGTKAA